MRRRIYLSGVAAWCTTGLAGCAGLLQLGDVRTPARVSVRNDTDEPRTGTVSITADRSPLFSRSESTFDESFVVDPATATEIGTVPEPGEYTIAVESDHGSARATGDITWDQLTDCNWIRIQIELAEDDIAIAITSTLVGC